MSLFFFIVISLFSLPLSSPNSPAIGVTYRPKSSSALPSAEAVSSAVLLAGIDHLFIEDPDPATLHSLIYSEVSLILSLPDPATAARSAASARRWLSVHVLPFHPRLRISAIAVGRDVTSPDLLPAIFNLRSACSDLGLPNFQVSTIHSFSRTLDPAFPPSAARFRSNLTLELDPLLLFLNSTGSPFLIDLYPFEVYRTDVHVPIGFAMFEEEAALGYRDDPGTGLRYRNLFDMMADSALAALAAAGYPQLQIAVSGTGWPSGGAKGATAEFAGKYIKGVTEHVRSGVGTPMRRDGISAVFLHELFDADGDLGSKRHEWEKHMGIWNKNLSTKYEVEFYSGAAAAAAAWVWCLVFNVLLLSAVVCVG